MRTWWNRSTHAATFTSIAMTEKRAVDVTVVIPALNRATVLRRALDSVAHQTVRPAAVVVIDDGSIDSTSAVASANGAATIRHATPRGSAEARNRGIEVATTEWVAFLDSDDAWMNDHLERLVGVAGDADLVSATMIDSFGRIRGNAHSTPTSVRPADLFFPENIVCTSAVLARTSALKAVGGFRSIERAEDLDLWVRLLERGPAVSYPQTTVLYFQPQRYPDTDLHLKNQSGTIRVIDAFTSERWNTPALRRRVFVLTAWDDIRFLLHQGARRRALRLLPGLLDLRNVAPMLTLLLHRRRARIKGKRTLHDFGIGALGMGSSTDPKRPEH